MLLYSTDTINDEASGHLLTSLQNSADEDDDEAEPDLSPKQPRPTSGAFSFRLRVALRSSSSTQQPTEEDEDEVKDKKKRSKVKEEVQHARQTKGVRRLKFKGEPADTPVTLPSPPEDHGSDSALDVPDSFLSKREQNIKANKAMVNCLFCAFIKEQGKIRRGGAHDQPSLILKLYQKQRGVLGFFLLNQD